jgi:histidinol-phosphate aminotransferase
MDIQTLIQPHIREVEAYEAPDWEALAGRANLSPDRLVRLDANENAYGPAPSVTQALARFTGYSLYPDYRALTAAIARYAGARPEQVVLGNGGDEIIDLVVRLFVAPGEATIVCPPAFGMYAVSVAAQAGQVLTIPRGDDFALDVEAIAARVDQGDPRPKLLFVASPGNPDGLAIPLATIRRLLALPLAVAVDEAYVEFGGETAVPLLAAHPNLVVLRTFSKWAGMAGLRLGYALAAPEVAEAMARLRSPYSVNAAAVVAALATLDDTPHAQTTIARIVAERGRLQAALARLPGVQPVPGQANFVLCFFDDRAGREIAAALTEQGILVRSFSDPRLDRAVRITVGRPEQNDALLAALGAILDVDGPPAPPTPHAERGRRANLESPARDVRPGGDRSARIQRQTRESEVCVELHLDGTGQIQARTGLGFLDHMLAQVAVHGLFDLTVRAAGDLEVDAHHTVEDVAIALGQALDAALGDRRGTVRMGHAYAPLDEALALVVVDLSGRPYAVVAAEFAAPRIGAVDTDLIVHFLETLAFHARMSLHARLLAGRNEHHKAEALFKALGRALDAASRLDPRRQGIPSTKGVL